MTLTASRFLDPRADVVFKKVFGEHANLPASFLNAVMPLTSPIVSITYLPSEQAPDIPELKRPISAYNKAELRAYNEYRDAVQTEATLLEDRFERGEAKGRAEGREEGELCKAQEVAKALIDEGMKDDFIVRTTGLSLAEVQSLRSGG